MRKFPKKLFALLLVLLCGCSGAESAATEPAEEQNAIVIEANIPVAPVYIRASCVIDTARFFSPEELPPLYSDGVFMAELKSGTVVAEKAPDERLIPASLTKIMTALVCFEKIKDLDETVECPQICFDDLDENGPNFEGASLSGIEPEQDNITYRDCLYGLMLPSGCEAANIIAYNVGGGDMSAFIEMMNETAEKAGCKNTHFSNAHGLYEEDNYSSARDIFLITRYAMERYPEFTEISCSAAYEMPPNKAYPNGYIIPHTNRMMLEGSDYYYEGVSGLKTGSINEYFSLNEDTGEWEKVKCAGVRGLVAVYEKNGCRYLLSTLSAPFYNSDGTVPKDPFTYLDHAALFDETQKYSYKNVFSKGDVLLTLSVRGGNKDSVEITAGKDYSVFLPDSAGTGGLLNISFSNPSETLRAPIKKGEQIGELVIKESGRTTTIPLLAAKAVEAEAAVGDAA